MRWLSHFLSRVSRRVPDEDCPHHVIECVDVLTRTGETRGNGPYVETVVEYEIKIMLHILTADKEGCFVFVPGGVFCDKALTAIQKNFKPIDVKESKVKERAVSLLSSHNLEH